MKPTEEKTSEVKTTTEEINNETTDVKVEPSEDSVVNLNASEIQKLKLLTEALYFRRCQLQKRT